MSKQTNPARTCADCLHCQACHLWNSGAISDSVAPKCPQFKPARYVTLAELQDLYRMHKGELVPVVHARWEPIDGTGDGIYKLWRCSECKNGATAGDETGPDIPYCFCCGAKMDGGAEDGV